MLYVFVEGADDEKYFNKLFDIELDKPKYIQYAGMKDDKVSNYIRSIVHMDGCDYLFVGDADGKDIEGKVDDLCKKYRNLEPDKTIIVQFEIESWYYAGASLQCCQTLRMKNYVHNTDNFTKEDFNKRLPKKADRKLVMASILNQYDLQLAMERNKSLQEFTSR